MLEITITNGGIKTRKLGSKVKTFVTWPKERFMFPCNQYSYTPPAGLMPCEEFYNGLKAEGCPKEKILEKMIRLYIPWFCFNVGHLEQLSTCLGLIGHRGSGKTASAVYMMIFDYLIRDLPVFSNVELAVKVRYRDCAKIFRSQPWKGTDMLDIKQDCRGGVVFVDEINLSAAEGSRFMAGANLAWSNDLQQLRKKQLNVIWTAQSWGSVDNRTRWQSDWVIETQDCFNDRSYKAKCPGDKVKWTVYELSGLSGQFDLAYELEHKWLMHYKLDETRMVWIRPISWPAYDTYQAQSADYIQQYKLQQAESDKEFKQVVLEEKQAVAQNIVDQVIGWNLENVWAEDIWESTAASRPIQTQVGTLLAEHYDHKLKRRNGKLKKYYFRKGGNDGHKE